MHFQPVLSRRVGTIAIILVAIGVSAALLRNALCADDNPGKPPDAAVTVQQLQQQLADLKKQIGEMGKSRIVAAGTATYTRPAFQDNKSFSRVKLSAETASKLGDDYIVLLTNRFPTGGYPYFEAYWKRSADGFDIYLVDISMADGTSASYDNPNSKYLIDWAVVKK